MINWLLVLHLFSFWIKCIRSPCLPLSVCAELIMKWCVYTYLSEINLCVAHSCVEHFIGTKYTQRTADFKCPLKSYTEMIRLIWMPCAFYEVKVLIKNKKKSFEWATITSSLNILIRSLERKNAFSWSSFEENCMAKCKYAMKNARTQSNCSIPCIHE